MSNISAVEDFLAALAIEKNYSAHTIASYRRNLNQFADWLTSNNLPLVMQELNSMVLRNYISYLRGRVKRITIKQKLATIQSFFRYLKELHPQLDLPQVPKQIKRERTQIQSLSQSEVFSLLEAVIKRQSELKEVLKSKKKHTSRLKKQINNCCRDLAIIALLVGTGMRIGELTALNVTDIDRVKKFITVRGKGGRMRELFFDVHPLNDIILSYLDWRTCIANEQALFLNSRDGQRITARTVQRFLKDYLELANLPDTVSPHSLRHSYATISIEKGANIKAVSQLLGHSHVGTTLEFYTHLSKEHLRKVYQNTHPYSEQDQSVSDVMEQRKSILTCI